MAISESDFRTSKELCPHGKQRWERCVGCESDMLLGKTRSFTPSDAKSVACEHLRKQVASDVDAALAEKDRRIAELEDSIKEMALRIASPAREE